MKAALQQLYAIKRADDDVVPGQINSKVIQDIRDASLIVCDLTELNPNVMYELAVAHTLSKKVIQIAEAGTRLPFDLIQARTIFFDLGDLASHRRAVEQIARAEEALRTARRNSNPVIDSLEGYTYENFQSGVSPYDKELEALKARLDDLERARGSEGPASNGASGGVVIQGFEQALRARQDRMADENGKECAEAAGRVIELLGGRLGFERVAIDRTQPRRLIVYGDPTLDQSGVADLTDGFEVEFRLFRRRRGGKAVAEHEAAL